MRTDSNNTWWSSLRHGGMLIAPSRLDEYFPGSPQPLGSWIADNLRRDITNLKRGKTETETALINTVLKRVCEINDIDLGIWSSGSEVPSKYSHRLITSEDFRPRRVWESKNGDVFPVFVDKESRIGVGRGRRSTAKVIEWLRKSGLTIALLTNAQQFRLIYAGSDHDAWVEWDTELWFEEGKPSAQVDALRMLLSPHALLSVDGKPAPLIDAILESRKGEAELSQELGENVRRAVEILIKSHTPALRDIVDNSTDRDINKHIYLAATRIIMRMVVILFAEARDLLPRDNQVYNSSYSLQGLREQLDRVHASGRLKNREFAWPRILALFNIVYHGSHAAKLPITKYGGGLFKPGDRESTDPISKVLQIFESACFNPETNIMDDFTVHLLLKLLTQTNVKLRQGRSFTTAKVPVDFSNISSEYIGIIYEGLLDYELRRANVDDPIVFLNLGDQPALPLKRLEQMDDKQLSNLVEKLKAKPSKNPGGEEESDSENEEPDEDNLFTEDEDVIDEDTEEILVEETLIVDEPVEDDIRMTEFNRAVEWARRAAKAGGLVAKPRSKKQSEIDKFENEITIFANKIVNPDKIILPGEWYLVRWGGTRKGSGTFYTRPQLAYPTVVRTIRPLAYNLGPRTASPQSSESTGGQPGSRTASPQSSESTGGQAVRDPDQYTPKTPEQILALKICDPAMGSGSFLVGATRFLTDALFDSLHYHKRIQAYTDGTLICLAEGKPAEGDIAKQLLPCKPDDADFDEKLKAQLKRHVVEKCIYGVDINPLAVELARLSLWVETMDRNLPFEFIDHKLKVGNALIGCWFDRFQDYPALAWEREGGDKTHNTSVHYQKEEWTKAIKNIKNDVIKADLRNYLDSMLHQQLLDFNVDGVKPAQIHTGAVDVFQKMHAVDVHEPDKRERIFREEFQNNPAVIKLKEAFDTWCAIWFWPADKLDSVPKPTFFMNPPDQTRNIVLELTRKHQFFHWEIEFPDVFAKQGSGFDAIVGNPPWENEQANPKEFFSNIDPMFRTYGRLESLEKMKGIFNINPAIERDWLDYCGYFKWFSNWINNTAFPFGDPDEEKGDSFSIARGKENIALHDRWRERRSKRWNYSSNEHPFQYQVGRIFTYKLFMEITHALLKDGGIFGLIVPSGIYTDAWSTDLRKLFINQCSWDWLFGFENRDGIFDIHRSFKFCPVIVRKGGSTENIKTAFMRRNLKDWEDGEKYVIPYSKEQVTKFSPRLNITIEIREVQEFTILRKIYSQSILLDSDKVANAGVKNNLEFMMNTDAALFPHRDTWLKKGFHYLEYGKWINDLKNYLFPLYQGAMIHQFDFCHAQYESGSGNKAKWRKPDKDTKTLLSQYLMEQQKYYESTSRHLSKLVYRKVTRSTDQRSMIASIIPDFPCGDSLYVVSSENIDNWVLCMVFNSFVFDFCVRLRLAGINLNTIDEFPIFKPETINPYKRLEVFLACLNFVSPEFSPNWLQLTHQFDNLGKVSLSKLLAITPHERLRLRSMLDAIVAELYGLDYDDFAYILKDCDHPTEQSTGKSFTRALDPKGFWRVDKQKDPELRHTVLSLVAFKDLKDMIESCDGDRDKGIEKFCAQNDSDGWMLPETLTLADYEFQHSNEKDYVIPERAKSPQPVASFLGERFLPWQLEQSVEDSWKECEMHARNILGPDGFNDLMAEIRGEKKKEPKPEASGVKKSKKTDSFGLFD
jgi:hypothetical protein